MNKIKTPFVAPLVDQLSIRVLVDSAYERFLPKTSHEFCNIEHVGKIPGRQMTTLACEWGLSLHLESLSNGENAQYLLDFGYTPEIISRNFELLDIDPKKISGLILSHAHRDHYGGMEGFIDSSATKCATICVSLSAGRVFLKKDGPAALKAAWSAGAH